MNKNIESHQLNNSRSSSAKKLTRVLVELAEAQLQSAENKDVISEHGLKKLRSRLV
ncbi:hypothetical protein [Ekhidna sp.]